MVNSAISSQPLLKVNVRACPNGLWILTIRALVGLFAYSTIYNQNASPFCLANLNWVYDNLTDRCSRLPAIDLTSNQRHRISLSSTSNKLNNIAWHQIIWLDIRWYWNTLDFIDSLEYKKTIKLTILIKNKMQKVIASNLLCLTGLNFNLVNRYEINKR